MTKTPETIKSHRCLLLLATFVIAFGQSGRAQTLASAKPPIYPLTARAAGIDGPVMLRGTISKQGKMQDIHVLSGPTELRQAAVDAVLGWTYKPYTHFGRVVEVDTTVTVNFNMGAGQKKLDEKAKAQAELAKSTQPASTQSTSQPPL